MVAFWERHPWATPIDLFALHSAISRLFAVIWKRLLWSFSWHSATATDFELQMQMEMLLTTGSAA